ncbi:MAG: sulfite exporter TauE/SafE family protein, partial [Methyloligellaceae bacterium]
MDPLQLAALAAFAFLGALVQASTGFGLSAVAAPFFLLILESGAAIQILAVANFALAVTLAPRLRDAAPRGLLANLLVGSLVGAPLGLVIFLTAGVATLKLAVGLVVVLFALILLARELGLFPNDEAVAGAEGRSRRAMELAVGALAGTLGVAFAFFAPPIIFYLLLVRAGKDTTR